MWRLPVDWVQIDTQYEEKKMTKTCHVNAVQSDRFDGITRHRNSTVNQKQSETRKKDQSFKNILDIAIEKN